MASDDFKSRIGAARAKGYSDEEILGALAEGKPDFAPKFQSAKSKGYSPTEILEAFSEGPAPTQQQQPESTMQRLGKDASIGWRAGWSQAAHTAANAANLVGAKETSKSLSGWSKEEEPKPEEYVGRDSVLDQSVIGAASIPGSVAEYSPALALKGSPLAAAAIGAISKSDKGKMAALEEGVKTGIQFKLLQLGEGLPTRFGRGVAAGAINAASSAVSGGDTKQNIAAALLGGVAGATSPDRAAQLRPLTDRAPIIKIMKQTLIPSKVSEAAEKTTANIREAFGKRERDSQITHEALEMGRNFFDKQKVNPNNIGGISDASLDFTEKYESDKIDKIDPAVRGQARVMEAVFDHLYKENHKRNLIETQRDNYLSHLYTRDGQEDTDLHKEFSKKPLQGAAGFKKQRVFDTIKDFMDWAKANPEKSKGVKLLTNNPIEMGLFGMREQYKLLHAYDFLSAQLNDGLMEYVRPENAARVNELKRQGWVPAPAGTDKALAGITIELTKKGHPGGGTYYMPADAARVIDNLMAPGLNGKPLMRSLMYGTGALNKFQLGASLRHIFTTMLEASIGQMALTEKYLATGISQRRPDMLAKSIHAAGKIITSPFDPWANVAKEGARKLGIKTDPTRSAQMVKQFVSPGSYQHMETMADLTAIVGGRVGQEAIYRAGEIRAVKMKWQGAKQVAEMAWRGHGDLLSLNPKYRGDLMKRMRSVSDITKMTSGLLGVPGAVMERMTQPIFEYAVPMLKVGSFMRMMEYEIDRLKPELDRIGADTPEGKKLVRAAGQKVWDSVDNRLGTFVYDNLAWNNHLKQSLMIGLRSVGWRLGTVREIGGGLADWKNAFSNSLKGQKAEFTHRMAYTIALPVVVGTLGAMANYLMTGEAPKDMEDLYRPRTGQKDEQGRDVRISFASYMNDVYHMLPMTGERYPGRVWRYVQGAVNPGVEVMIEIYQNSDFSNNQIRDKDGSPVQQLEDIAKYAAEQFLPISFKSFANPSHLKGDHADKNLPSIDKDYRGPGIFGKLKAGNFSKGMAGISAAPADEMKPASERYTDEHLKRMSNESGGKNERVSEKATYRKDLIKALKYKDEGEFRTIFDKAVKDGIYKLSDEKEIRKDASQSAGVYKFTRLDVVDMAQAYLYAVKDPKVSEDEKKMMLNFLTRKLAKSMADYQKRPDDNREKIRLLNNVRLIGMLDETGAVKPLADQLASDK